MRDLLAGHYDPIYLESMRRNFGGVARAVGSLRWDGSAADLRARPATTAIAAGYTSTFSRAGRFVSSNISPCGTIVIWPNSCEQRPVGGADRGAGLRSRS